MEVSTCTCLKLVTIGEDTIGCFSTGFVGLDWPDDELTGSTGLDEFEATTGLDEFEETSGLDKFEEMTGLDEFEETTGLVATSVLSIETLFSTLR